MMAELCGNQSRMWPMGRSAQMEANQMEANQMEADGLMEVMVMDESKDAVNYGGLCHIYLVMS